MFSYDLAAVADDYTAVTHSSSIKVFWISIYETEASLLKCSAEIWLKTVTFSNGWHGCCAEIENLCNV